MIEHQPELQMFKVAQDDRNVEWFVGFLAGRDWTTANDILRENKMLETEGNRRALRAYAEGSRGRVAGGQKGYKLVEQMTAEEFHHWRNWMNHQAELMQRRIVEADKVFYGQKAVSA